MPSAAVRAMSSGMRTTLSCRENSVCRRRWTKLAGMAREFTCEAARNAACDFFQELGIRCSSGEGNPGSGLKAPLQRQIPAVLAGHHCDPAEVRVRRGHGEMLRGEVRPEDVPVILLLERTQVVRLLPVLGAGDEGVRHEHRGAELRVEAAAVL